MAEDPKQPTEQHPRAVVCIAAIAAVVGLAALHIVTGIPAVFSIVAICMKTDVGAVLDLLRKDK